MPKKIFTSQKIAVVHSGGESWVQCLVSTVGAKYVFDQSDLPMDPDVALLMLMKIFYKGISAKARFVRERNQGGTIYNLRFLQPGNLLLSQIEKDVHLSGIHSPFVRRFPRLSTVGNIRPAPIIATVYLRNSSYFLNVLNFTLGGVLLEYRDIDLPELSVDAELKIDLTTNEGVNLTGISGKLAYICDEIEDVEKGTVRLHLGIKFDAMPFMTESRYRALLRSHCEILREEILSEVDAS